MIFVRGVSVALGSTVLALLYSSSAFAQETTTVAGTVVAGTKPVAGAVVVLEAAIGGPTGTTDAAGKFSIANVVPGTYHLVVRADGFLPTRSDLTVTASMPAVEVKLNTDPHYTEVVSVSPDVRSQFDSYQPTSVLGGLAIRYGPRSARSNEAGCCVARSVWRGPSFGDSRRHRVMVLRMESRATSRVSPATTA